MTIDLTQVEDWEKASILQVLRRNERIKQREERRLQQIAVRVQLERMDDRRSPQMECQLKTLTGEWHKEMMMKRSSNRRVYDVPHRLFRRISSDLTSTASRRRSDSCASTVSLRHNDDEFPGCASEERHYREDKMQDVQAWVIESQMPFGEQTSSNESLMGDEVTKDVEVYDSANDHLK